MEGFRFEGGWCARVRPYSKRAQNEHVFRKKSRFLAARVRGSVRARRARIGGARACVCVRPCSASRHTYRAPRRERVRTHTCALTACDAVFLTSI